MEHARLPHEAHGPALDVSRPMPGDTRAFPGWFRGYPVRAAARSCEVSGFHDRRTHSSFCTT
eukprot:7515261-Alexandrium_andersonii.AAC.1